MAATRRRDGTEWGKTLLVYGMCADSACKLLDELARRMQSERSLLGERFGRFWQDEQYRGPSLRSG
jgi:hypothetical protein